MSILMSCNVNRVNPFKVAINNHMDNISSTQQSAFSYYLMCKGCDDYPVPGTASPARLASCLTADWLCMNPSIQWGSICVT